MGRYLDYMVVPFFWGGCDTLGASGGALNAKVPVLLTHLWQLRGYSALTDLVKNQSTGVD